MLSWAVHSSSSINNDNSKSPGQSIAMSEPQGDGSIAGDRGAAEESRSSVGGGEAVDGGVRGWCALISTWLTWFMWGGLLKGLGVLLPTLKVQFVSKTWIIGWIIAMVTGAVGLSGVFAGALGKRFGTGRVAVFGGLLVGAGFILGSLTTTTVQLAILLTLAAGTGLGFINVLTRAALGICFHKNYTTASAISQTGLSVAMFVCAPVAQVFLDTYGWRGTMLLLGAISLHLVVCGQLLCKAMAGESDGYQLVSTTDDESALRQSSAQQPSCGWMTRLRQSLSQLFRATFKELDFRLFGDIRFLLILLFAICIFFPFDMWYVYFISMAESKGFTPIQAAIFVTYAGIGNIVLKVVHAPLVDRGIVGLRTMMTFSIVVCFVSLFVLPWVNSYWAMALSSILYVGCLGVLANLYDVIVKVVLGKERMACAFGWIGIILGVLRVLIGFFPGWIYDTTGSYDTAYLVLGGMVPVGLLALGCLVFVERRGST